MQESFSKDNILSKLNPPDPSHTKFCDSVESCCPYGPRKVLLATKQSIALFSLQQLTFQVYKIATSEKIRSVKHCDELGNIALSQTGKVFRLKIKQDDVVHFEELDFGIANVMALACRGGKVYIASHHGVHVGEIDAETNKTKNIILYNSADWSNCRTMFFSDGFLFAACNAVYRLQDETHL